MIEIIGNWLLAAGIFIATQALGCLICIIGRKKQLYETL